MVLYKYIIDEANGSRFLLDHDDVRFLSILSKNNKISKEIWLMKLKLTGYMMSIISFRLSLVSCLFILWQDILAILKGIRNVTMVMKRS